ncbi:MAG: hypothetical protein CFE27_07550 [Alphaproteobacteria bacterium PA1]|nr:MAG: hypothetical protein CFE27_07550 [Alphaproteobacteria bacterium PA1]
MEPASETALPETDYARSMDPIGTAKEVCGLSALNFSGPNPEIFAGAQLTVQWETARQLTGYCRMLGPIPGGTLDVEFQGTPSVLTAMNVRAGSIRFTQKYDLVDLFVSGQTRLEPGNFSYSPSALIWASLGGLMRQLHPLPNQAPANFFSKACKAPYLIGIDKKDPTLNIGIKQSEVLAVVRADQMPELNSAPPKGPQNFPATKFWSRDFSDGKFGGTIGFKGMAYYSAFLSEVGQPPKLASIALKTHWRSGPALCPVDGPSFTPAPAGSDAEKVLQMAREQYRANVRPTDDKWVGSSVINGVQDDKGNPVYLCTSTNLNDQTRPDYWKLSWGTTEQNNSFDVDFFNDALLDENQKVIGFSTFARIRGSRSYESISCNTKIFD